MALTRANGLAHGPTAGQLGDPLFEVPHDRLGARLHEEVFGQLPAGTARALDLPEVAAAVRPLLAAGWRPAQLAARVGALPAGDPVPVVLAFLQQLRERDSPQRQWEREQAEREREQTARREQAGRAASEESRARWAAEARAALGLPPRPRAVPPSRPTASCASCGGRADFFVTRQVRLCECCVQALGSGSVQLGPRAQAG